MRVDSGVCDDKLCVLWVIFVGGLVSHCGFLQGKKILIVIWLLFLRFGNILLGAVTGEASRLCAF